MKKLSLILATLASAILLSACDITLGGGVSNEINKAFLESNSDVIVVRNGTGADNIVVASGSAGSGSFSAKYYKIVVRDIPSNQDVVYFEAASENVALILYDSNGAARRQSNSKKYFGKIGVGLTGQDIASQAISVSTTCRGSCIIVNKGEGVVYLRVAAKSSTSASFKLYAFSDTYKDSTEPQNQPVSGTCNFALNSQSIVIAPTAPHRGAIETVEDVDCFSSKVATNSVTLAASPNTTFNIKARLLDQNGRPLKVAGTNNNAVLTVGPSRSTSQATLTTSGRVLVEISSADGRAAPSGNSQYVLTFNRSVTPVTPKVDKAYLEANARTLAVRNGTGADNVVVATGSAGQSVSASKYYKIAVRDIPSSQDVVYFEANNENVELTLYDSTGKARRQSNSKKYFGTVGVGLTSQDMASQAISVSTTCRGSCIIVNKGEGIVYLKVSAKRNSTASYRLYAFSDTYKDSTEPQNQPVSGTCNFALNSQSIVIAPTAPHKGAIETVEDVDCFSSKVATNSVTLAAAPNTTFNIKAKLLDQNGRPLKVAGTNNNAVLTVGPSRSTSQATLTTSGRVLVEISSADGRAAPSANSQYTLTFNNPTR